MNRQSHRPETPPRVLIAEDSPTQAVKLQYLLERGGYATVVTRDGQEAIASAQLETPDLLISDIVMPRMNGYDLARSFRSDPNLSGVPIILLTTLSDPHDIILGLDCGADNFIRKPYEDEYLLQRINYILTNRQLRQREKVQMGIQIDLSGNRHFITAERQQIFDLLISTYEEAVHLNKSLEHSNQSLNGLFRVAEGLNQCVAVSDVLERVVERAMEFPCVDAGWVYTMDAGGALHVAAYHGDPSIVQTAQLLEAECECKRRFATGTFEQIANVFECGALAGGVEGMAAHACIPLFVDDRPSAILNLANAQRRPFTEDELRMFYGVGQQAGLALERARLHGRLEHLVEQRTLELQEKTNLLDHLISASPTNIYALAFRGGRFVPTWTSENLAAITGWSASEGLDPGWLAGVAHPEDAGTIAGAEERLVADDVTSAEYRIQHKNGGYIWIHDERRLLRDDRGNILEAIGSRSDVSARKSAEDALRQTEELLYQSQKLESIGSLAGGIAHDMNNVLSAVCGYTELVMSELPPESSQYADLNNVLTAGHHGAKLIAQILAFSRKQVLRPETLDLNRVVGEFTTMIRRLLGEDIELANTLAGDLHPVIADAVQVEQVIMNLVINARDAMPDGGTLAIETANVDLDAAYCGKHPNVTPGPYAMLAVSDSGTGMDEATRNNIFDPFFTTKDVGHGTGLGLATVYGIVKQHNGSIWVYSEPGHGTTFKVYFPATVGASAAERPDHAGPIHLGGDESIVVVEDDGIVRQLIVETLLTEGYHVESAASPAEALETLKNRGSDFDLLVTDVILPGMNGKELYRKLHENAHGLKVLYVSGYTRDIIGRHGFLEKGVNHLQKPFTIRNLLGAVRGALAAPQNPL